MLAARDGNAPAPVVRWFKERQPRPKTQYEWRRIIKVFGENRPI
jgi:hypothetical protein